MKRAYAYIVLAAILFSTMEIAGRVLARDLNPTQINVWRFLIASLVLLPSAVMRVKRRDLRLGFRDILYFLAAGLVGIALCMELFQIALALTKASTVAIIISCMPMAIIPFACLFLKERFTQGTALALVFCVLGICFIINPFEIDPELGGILAAIGAMITFAIYSVMGKAAVATYGSIPFMCFSFLAGALILLGLAVAADVLGPQLGNPVLARLAGVSLIDGINPANALCLLYFAVFGTGLGFLFYFLAMEETSASTGSIVFFIKPALAPLLACLLLGERIAPNVLLGIALVIVGTWFAFRGARRRVAA